MHEGMGKKMEVCNLGFQALGPGLLFGHGGMEKEVEAVESAGFFLKQVL